MGARLIGLNVRGVRKGAALDALLREANRKRIDALLLQEVNVKESGVQAFVKRTGDVGYLAYVSPSDTPDERGGTAT